MCETGFYPTQGCVVNADDLGVCKECEIRFFHDEKINTNPRCTVSHTGVGVHPQRSPFPRITHTSNINRGYELLRYNTRRRASVFKVRAHNCNTHNFLYVADVYHQQYNFITNRRTTYCYFSQAMRTVMNLILTQRLFNDDFNERPQTRASSKWFRYGEKNIHGSIKID